MTVRPHPRRALPRTHAHPAHARGAHVPEAVPTAACQAVREQGAAS